MPFDPTPIETKPDVFSLEGLIAWLEKQPATLTYDYTSPRKCLLSRYLIDAGFDDPVIFRLGDMGRRIPEDMHHAAHGGHRHLGGFNFSPDRGPWHSDLDFAWTYGAALSRALALREKA